MKLPNPLRFFAALVLIAMAGGCADYPYDPTKAANTHSPGDKVEVVGMAVNPDKPVAPGPWRVWMQVKNVGAQALTGVTYTFSLAPSNRLIGQGTIARLEPNQVVKVESNETKSDNGEYRVEGKVFLAPGQEEEKFEDRQNNVMEINILVAQ